MIVKSSESSDNLRFKLLCGCFPLASPALLPHLRDEGLARGDRAGHAHLHLAHAEPGGPANTNNINIKIILLNGHFNLQFMQL